MSTFPGPLEEIDNVSVDRFDEDNLKSTVYFLSHHHADHMYGIRECGFIKRLQDHEDIFLYCSPLTKVWLDLRRANHKVKELPINSEVEVRIPGLLPGRDPYVKVTLLPAGHCPGSVMFLFNWESKYILYSGDIRMNAKVLKKMEALHNISLDTLYLDTTFYPYHYQYLPSRDTSINKLTAFCMDWLRQNEENVIDIRRSARIGIEYVYIHLYEKLGTCIHVSEQEWQQYGRIPDLAKALTTDMNVKARIHACVFASNSNKSGALEKVHTDLESDRIRSVKLYALSAKNLRESDDILSYSHTNNLYKLVYSSHCSNGELREIVSYLSPKKLVPCVVYDAAEQEIIDALRPNASPVSVRTSSFESTFDLSPKRKSSQDEQPSQHSSQTSMTSISSIEDTPTKQQVLPSKRYTISESSDDEQHLSPSKADAPDRGWTWMEETTEEKPWAKYMQLKKKVRRD